MLAVLVTAGTGWAPRSTFPTGATQQGAVSQQGQDTTRRPFRHIIHDALPCRGCHGSGATHRVTVVRTARDCATCHHDPQRGLSCTKCHSPGSLAASRTVVLSFTLQVSDSPRTREVGFQHAPHVDSVAGLACRDCHTTPVTLARNRQCGSCHDEHHAGRAECTTCHAPPRKDAHDVAVHLSCTGRGCHSTARAPAPALSRTLCLFCHAKQRDHEPGGSCALCHRIPAVEATGRAPRRASTPGRSP